MDYTCSESDIDSQKKASQITKKTFQMNSNIRDLIKTVKGDLKTSYEMGAGYFHVGEKIHLLTYLTTHAKK
jgi:hypothetical protein